MRLVFSLWVTVLCMKCCGFVCEDFPKENQMYAKTQQPLFKPKISNFLYTLLPFRCFFFRVQFVSTFQRLSKFRQRFTPQCFSIPFEWLIPQLAKFRKSDFPRSVRFFCFNSDSANLLKFRCYFYSTLE